MMAPVEHFCSVPVLRAIGARVGGRWRSWGEEGGDKNTNTYKHKQKHKFKKKQYHIVEGWQSWEEEERNTNTSTSTRTNALTIKDTSTKQIQ